MGKKSKTKSDLANDGGNPTAKVNGEATISTSQASFLAGDVSIDPLLASLFEKSVCPNWSYSCCEMNFCRYYQHCPSVTYLFCTGWPNKGSINTIHGSAEHVGCPEVETYRHI
jgi:hypothetical protein